MSKHFFIRKLQKRHLLDPGKHATLSIRVDYLCIIIETPRVLAVSHLHGFVYLRHSMCHWSFAHCFALHDVFRETSAVRLPYCTVRNILWHATSFAQFSERASSRPFRALTEATSTSLYASLKCHRKLPQTTEIRCVRFSRYSRQNLKHIASMIKIQKKNESMQAQCKTKAYDVLEDTKHSNDARETARREEVSATNQSQEHAAPFACIANQWPILMSQDTRDISSNLVSSSPFE